MPASKEQQRLKKERISIAVEMWKEGHTAKEIALRLRVGTPRVYAYLKEGGIAYGKNRRVGEYAGVGRWRLTRSGSKKKKN